MKLKFRIDDRNPAHVRFTVFVNGANAGTLCMRTEEFDEFCLQQEAGGTLVLE